MIIYHISISMIIIIIIININININIKNGIENNDTNNTLFVTINNMHRR